MNEADRYILGLKSRRKILGDDYVDQAIAGTTDLTADFQNLLTRLAWGEIWTRPGLDQSTRRLLTLAMLIALNRGDEFKMHVRAALDHGMDIDIIKETILHSAVYCGMPAANAAFRDVAELLTGRS